MSDLWEKARRHAVRRILDAGQAHAASHAARRGEPAPHGCRPWPGASWHEREFPREILADLFAAPQQEVGTDRCRLACCDQNEAEHVRGVGVSGCVARVTDIDVLGSVSWPLAQPDEARDHARRRIGRSIR
jgi:hypothetical protein